MKTKIIFRINLILFIILLSGFYQKIFSALKGGTAKVNITPPVGICWAFDDKPMVDIADELYAKALVLDDGFSKIAIISTDLLWIPGNMTSEIRQIIKEKTGIPEINILVCATHTHYVPNIYSRHVTTSPIDTSYVQTLTKQIASAVFMAYKNMKDVKVGAAKGEIPEIIYNRRTKRADGTIQMSFTLPQDTSELIFGPIDPEVGIIRIEDNNSNILASVINFSCHPTSAGYEDMSYIISADYPGYTTKVIEQMEGGICLFTLGTAGDIVVIERGEKQRQQIGTALGAEALRRIQRVPTTDDVSIKVLKKNVTLPLKKKISSDSILYSDSTKNYINTEIQAFSLGDIYILGLPGENLVELGLEIKNRFRDKNLFIITLSNDIVGYVCHSEAYDEGGYEPTRGTNLAKGAGEIIIQESVNILNQLK